MKALIMPHDFEPENLSLINTINEILSLYSVRITVRQCYYQLVSRNLITNDEYSYKKISRLLSEGRKAGLIDFDAITDKSRTYHEISHWHTPEEILEAVHSSYRIDTRKTQPFYIEIFIEKDALISVIADTCDKLDVNFLACKGYNSTTFLYETAKRFINTGKKGIILYGGDCDPSGKDMVRDIQKRIREYGADVDIKNVALNLDQVKKFNLPPQPVKETDPRKEKYKKETGLNTCWELDALPPDVLIKVFEDEVNSLTDFDALKKMQELQKEHKRYLRKLFEEIA